MNGRNRNVNIKNICHSIRNDQDENMFSIHYNMLICMFASRLLVLGAAISIIIGQHDSYEKILTDCSVLLVFAAIFELYSKSTFISNEKSIHVISPLYTFVFVYIAFRFYSFIGPSIWALGTVQLLFALGQNNKIMINYLVSAMIAFGIYIGFSSAPQIYPYYNVCLILFFVIAWMVASIVYMIIDTRKQMIKNQIEQRRKTEQVNIRLSLYDHLTGLPNKMHFNDRLNQAMLYAKQQQSSLYVLFVDIDNFKLINDTRGHSMGDELLKKIAVRLSDSLRKSDVVARIGGDEFLIFLQDVSCEQDAAKVANNILAAISRPFFIENKQFSISCSIGISRFLSERADVDTLIQCADLAMYKAKEEGKNCYAFYSENLKNILLKELDMVNDMQHALRNNEFILHYQPQINSRTKQIIGIEALIRWNHPTLGLLFPDQFLPIAEKTGFIVPIGEWVLRTVCMQNKAWHDEGFVKVPVAVNMSGKQLLNKTLVSQLSTILLETDLGAKYLEIEITEKLLISDIIKVKAEMEAIRDLGVRIAIDDFGTGYTSIINIKQLPIDVIKIPLEFVHGIDINLKDESIISVILGLAASLDIDVIAEGVETINQLEFLNDRSCNNIQGYYFCKPMEASTLRTAYAFWETVPA